MKEITSQKEDYAKWYTDVIEAAELADYAPVKGCMIIRPYGYSIWENIQRILDGKIKETGHQNAYFPLFIPKSFLSKEAAHVEGFAKECAIVTHSRLKAHCHDGQAEVVVDPESKLEEELIVRPTSETIINAMFAKWVGSWRDLPLLINQWANIVRWEMRTRLFLRTAEFLWQEGHTAHATAEEAEAEAQKMLHVYRDFVEGTLGIPVLLGEKTPTERFAGADRTYTIEAMMQDRKALQAGTSHNLGQNFAKAFQIQFQNQDGQLSYVWQTSWGVSTRLIGALIMAHGDDKGIILPPNIAPLPVVIVPIYRSDEERKSVCDAAIALQRTLPVKSYVDTRDQIKPGRKFYEWEKKGVPIRIELGPKEVAQNQVVMVNRVSGEKTTIQCAEFSRNIGTYLDQIQKQLFQRALEFRQKYSFRVDDYKEFQEKIEEPGGFLYVHWCGSSECEAKIKEETKATFRCIPLDAPHEAGVCVYCKKPSTIQKRLIAARAY